MRRKVKFGRALRKVKFGAIRKKGPGSIVFAKAPFSFGIKRMVGGLGGEGAGR